MSNKYSYNGGNAYQNINPNTLIDIGKVVDNVDPEGMGRIRVVIKGPSNLGGDDTVSKEKNLVYAFPMIPKFFGSTPKIGEAVLLMSFNLNEKQIDRLYIGPIISQSNQIEFDPYDYSAISPFSFKFKEPGPSVNGISAIKGVFPEPEDVAIQGRNNTDIIQKDNEVVIRAGKFVKTNPDKNNPFSFSFNNKTPAYIQIKNDVILKKKDDKIPEERGTVTNIVSSKINLLTHKDNTQIYHITDQDGPISDEELLKILETAHQLPYGDIMIEYMDLLEEVVLNHVHNGNGNPPTDLTTSGNKRAVETFKKKAKDLKKAMLSKNIRIN